MTRSLPPSSVISCRWDWCRSTFPSMDALEVHVKHEHIWPMKPMWRAEIALMRKMDLQSLRSSPGADSSTISRGLITGVSRLETPPPVPRMHPENEEGDTFDTFAQSSSPLRTHSPQRSQASPVSESLVRQDGLSGLSAAIEMFERTHGRKTNQRLRFPSRYQRSPTCRPPSRSSGSSQEVVEQQLTQEDDVDCQTLPRSEPPVEDEITDIDLRWPTDDESDTSVTEEAQSLKQSAPKQNDGLGGSPDPIKDRNFRCGSLDVPLGMNNYSAIPSSSSQAHPSQGPHSSSQPFVLQTQAPYSSPDLGWSQSQ